MHYIVGNWKSHKTTEEGRHWLEQFAPLFHPKTETEVVLAPTLVSLEGVAAAAAGLNIDIAFAAQDISPFPRGKYTGAVAADLVKGVAEYAIVGHAERRRYFHESGQEIINKVHEAVDVGITPLVCFADAIELGSLVAPLGDIDGSFLLAYTPHDPVVANVPEPAAQVAEMAGRVQRGLPQVPLLYGGAVNRDNCCAYLAIEGISGLFVGGASLDAAHFAAICNAV